MLYLSSNKGYMNMENLNLTQLEEQVLNSLISQLYAEAGYSDVDAKDIARDIKVDIKSVRGAVGSLVRKGIIDIDGNDSGYQIIYLRSQYWSLHPEWKNQMEDFAWRM
jgi:predicted transcriptional regulator